MIFGRPTIWCVKPSLLGVAAFAALLAAAPTEATASCGDYVRIAGEAHSGLMDLPLLPAEDQAASPLRDVPPPCNGPHCSGRPAPYAPPLSITLDVRTQPCCVPENLCPPLPEGASALADLAAPRPISRPTGIFHPPRRGF